MSAVERARALAQAKDRVRKAKRLAVSRKNRSGRYIEIERREAIARERADQQVVVRWAGRYGRDAYGRQARWAKERRCGCGWPCPRADAGALHDMVVVIVILPVALRGWAAVQRGAEVDDPPPRYRTLVLGAGVPARLEFDEAYRPRPSQLISVAQNRLNGLR